MKDLSQIALDKIKKKNIEPCPRWRFVLKNYSWWLAGVVFIFVGGLGSSVVFYMLINNDWDIYQKVGTSLISFALITMPYFWLVFLVLFIFLADYYLKHTKYGYRFSLIKMVSLSIFISILLGGLFYNIGIGEALDKEFYKRVPGYSNLIHNKEKFWMQPEKGLLVGIILEIENNNNFIIKSPRDRIWNIIGDNVLIRRMVDFSIGSRIKIIGEMKDDEVFIAEEVRPWIGRGNMDMQTGGHGMIFFNK